MDEVFDRVGGRFRISIADSTMMRILHCAMDKSHERAKSKDGFLERLSEISKFYQLAVIQLEGCLKFIQEETDHNGFESGDEEVLADLTDIRDRLAGRLKESEIAISEKDRELKERLENEWKLTQALEMKERKLDSLRKNLELERTKSEGIEELMFGNRLSVDEERDEEFSELKNSVEQQVWNIKQKLDPDYKLINTRCHQNFDDVKIEQMNSDIDILKETMDLAFGKMHCAMILSELEPVERQWGWMIENDVLAIFFKGFMEDLHGNFEAEVCRREKQFSIGLSNYLSDLERELHCLRDELEPHNTSHCSPERNNYLKAGRSSSEEALKGSTQKLEEDGDSHFVAKMIKNHESIIRRKSEEINTLKREIVKERHHCSSREEKEPISPRRKIRDVFTKLDSLITWNAKLGGEFNHSGDAGGAEIYSEKMLSEMSMTEQGKSQFDTLEDVWQKVYQNSVCQAADTKDLQSQMLKLKMEKDELNVQNMITEMVYTILLEGLMNNFRSELYHYSLKLAKIKNFCEDSLKKIVTECDEKLEIEEIEFQNREVIYSVVFGGIVNDLSSTLNNALTESQHLRAESNRLEDDALEEKLKEEISIICFREKSDEWNAATKRSETKCLAKQEIYQIAFEDEKVEIEKFEYQHREDLYYVVFGEVVNDLTSSLNHAIAENKHLRAKSNSLEDDALEERLKEEISIICFKEISNEWNEATKRSETVCLAKQEIHQIAFEETIRDAINTANQMQEAYLETLIREETYRLVLLKAVKEANAACAEQILIQKQNSHQEDNNEENLMLTSCSDRKESSAKHVAKHARELLDEMKCRSTSASREIEKASEQLNISKKLLDLLRSSLNIGTEKIERSDEMSSKGPSIQNKTFYFQLSGSEESTNSFDYNKFLQAFVNFKSTVEERLEFNTLRLEKIMHQLNPIAEFITSLKTRVLIYEKAFNRRCENLRTAEIEVDLLGDQVELLLDLLEKIYKTLHHHSPALRQYFEISDILSMIEKELIGAYASSK